MIFYKKHSNNECIEYSDALNESLCFGWIDSLVKRIDENKYARKFTPRKNKLKWSEINKNKVAELIRKDKMTPAGLEKIDDSIKAAIFERNNNKSGEKKASEFEMPDFILEEFGKNEPALINFNKLASTYKKHYILWITNPKRVETILNRLKEAVELLKENKKLGLK